MQFMIGKTPGVSILSQVIPQYFARSLITLARYNFNAV